MESILTHIFTKKFKVIFGMEFNNLTNKFGMDAKDINLKKLPLHETNPFIPDLKDKMVLRPKANIVVAKNEAIVDTITGELQEAVLMGRRRVVDAADFTKIYIAEMGILFDLKRTTQKLLQFILQTLDYENKVFIDYKRLKESMNISDESVFKGLKELVANKLLAKTIIPQVYWVNPVIICKGERFAIYREYVKAEKGKQFRQLDIEDAIKEEQSKKPEE